MGLVRQAQLHLPRHHRRRRDQDVATGPRTTRYAGHALGSGLAGAGQSPRRSSTMTMRTRNPCLRMARWDQGSSVSPGCSMVCSMVSRERASATGARLAVKWMTWPSSLADVLRVVRLPDPSVVADRNMQAPPAAWTGGAAVAAGWIRSGQANSNPKSSVRSSGTSAPETTLCQTSISKGRLEPAGTTLFGRPSVKRVPCTQTRSPSCTSW
jgi:hypothetical protein